jgi:hypothetical protein
MQYFYLSDSHYSYVHHYCGIVHYVCGLVVRSYSKESVDSCSRPADSSNCLVEKISRANFFVAFCIIQFILIIHIMFHITAFLGTLEFQQSTKHKGHLALYNCLVLGHTKYNGVQWFTAIKLNQFPAKPFYTNLQLPLLGHGHDQAAWYR